jgi:signal transduction histidine kinase/CheY-like chemotaxis protein
MSMAITRVEIRYEQDVVHARQRARLIAELLGFDRTDQTRLSTAVSEIARNAYQYGGGGQVEFLVEGAVPPQVLGVLVRDRGPGIKDVQAVLEGRYTSPAGMGLGIVGARRLVEHFHLETRPGEGTTVFLGKTLPRSAPPVTPQALARISETLLQTRPESPLEEIRLQNQELLRALEELRRRQEELEELNRELEDTNRGVLALYVELDDKALQLSRANQVQARFLSNMSHEFRTPLNSILALSRLLLDRVDGDLNTEQEKQAAFIRHAAEDLSILVNDLLDLAKIEAGKVQVRPRECTVEEIFSELRGMLRPLLTTRSPELVFEPPEGIPPLFTDDGKVAQILRNFLSNALKFTEQGEVRVSARMGDDGRAVLFAVADTGLGIAPEDQQRIFDEYTQVETAQRGRPKGVGLGLPISRRLAKMLGGCVGVESRPGVGSTFTAAIPVRYAPPEAGAEPAAALTADVTRRQVLVIEDDAATQLLYEKYLTGSGFEVLPALSIPSAWQVLQRLKPMAIVLDILMPSESDGWTFLAEVKASEATRDIPVVVVSVLAEQDKGLALGAEDYCVKPVERKWLLARLRDLARRAPLEKVLIIDDNDVDRYILKGYLADTRYATVEAADGAQGLRLAEAEQPDVIFLDLIMPGMSGFEVLQRLKENPATRDIPVIIVTAKTLDEAERRALKQQAQAVLSKEAPSREAAIQAVREALRQVAELHERKERPDHGR